jgi:hypothetical protein
MQPVLSQAEIDTVERAKKWKTGMIQIRFQPLSIISAVAVFFKANGEISAGHVHMR